MSNRTRLSLALSLSTLALITGACDEPDAPGAAETVLEADAELMLDEASPYRVAAGLAVPLAELDPGVRAIAEAHLHVSSQGMRGAEGWAGAELYPLALPLHRPDIAGPAYYEFKVFDKDGNEAGFMVVATGEHDSPVPEFNTRGRTPAEHLSQLASAPPATFYRLDNFITIAEDEAGAVTAATSEQLPVAPVEVPAGDALELTDWSAWPTLRRDFATGFARQIAEVRADHSEAWAGVAQLRDAAIAADAGDGASFRRTTWDVIDQGATVYECENNWAGPNNGPGDANLLTAKWDQILWDFRHVANSGNSLCASGCTPTGAAIVLAWIDQQSRNPQSGPWSRPDMGRAFFRYRQKVSIDNIPFIDHGRPPYMGLPAGQSMIPKAGIYDYSAAPSMSWVGQVATPSAIETQYSTIAQEDMRRYLLEIGMSMGTGCSGTAGNTLWWGVGGFQRFLDDHRIPATLNVDINVFSDGGVRDRVITSLRNTGAPGFVHTGGLSGHTEVVNAHTQCRVREKATNNITWTGAHYFYMNKGWGGGNIEGWLAIGGLYMSATLTPKIEWQKLVASHSGQCIDVPYGGAANGLGLQQVPCAAGLHKPQRFQFLPQADGSYMLQNGTSFKCIEVYEYSAANNAPVVQWDCYGGANQKWRAEMRPDGLFQLRNVNSNKCLEVYNFGQASGTGLVQYTCDGAASQVWDLQL